MEPDLVGIAIHPEGELAGAIGGTVSLVRMEDRKEFRDIPVVGDHRAPTVVGLSQILPVFEGDELAIEHGLTIQH